MPETTTGHRELMALILWLIAVVLVVAGILRILRAKDLLGGAALIILGFLVGPGGVSVFTTVAPGF